MAKRKTKEQRDIEQYNALLVRVSDICFGACGRVVDFECENLSCEELSRVVPALESLFTVEKTIADGKDLATNYYLFQPHNLNHYQDPTTITHFLFEHGVRA